MTLEEMKKYFGILGQKADKKKAETPYRVKRITSAVKTIHVDANPDKNGKKTVAVVFYNGDKQIVKCGKDDEFDPKIGVALAIAYESFGSRTHFAKFIERNGTFAPVIEPIIGTEEGEE